MISAMNGTGRRNGRICEHEKNTKLTQVCNETTSYNYPKSQGNIIIFQI